MVHLSVGCSARRLGALSVAACVGILLTPSRTSAGSVVYISLEQTVHTSGSIVVGKVTKIDRRRGHCSLSFSVAFQTLRVLKGGSLSSYARTYHVNEPGCPSGSFVLAPCNVDFRHDQTGKEVIFFHGGERGPACASLRDEAAIARLIKTPLTIDALITKLSECHDSNCFYLRELGRHRAKAVEPLERAILAKRGDRQLLFWALGRTRSPATCRALQRFTRLPDRVVPQIYVLEAIGNAGCTVLAPLVRQRLATDARSPYVVLQVLASLRDVKAVAALTAKLFDPAWEDKLLHLVLTLHKIGDKRAIGPLCRRLAQGTLKQPVLGDAIREAVKSLGGRC